MVLLFCLVPQCKIEDITNDALFFIGTRRRFDPSIIKPPFWFCLVQNAIPIDHKPHMLS
jgi:hypothetical protein